MSGIFGSDQRMHSMTISSIRADGAGDAEG
jgi:hypothetical protein